MAAAQPGGQAPSLCAARLTGQKQAGSPCAAPAWRAGARAGRGAGTVGPAGEARVHGLRTPPPRPRDEPGTAAIGQVAAQHQVQRRQPRRAPAAAPRRRSALRLQSEPETAAMRAVPSATSTPRRGPVERGGAPHLAVALEPEVDMHRQRLRCPQREDAEGLQRLQPVRPRCGTPGQAGGDGRPMDALRTGHEFDLHPWRQPRGPHSRPPTGDLGRARCPAENSAIGRRPEGGSRGEGDVRLAGGGRRKPQVASSFGAARRQDGGIIHPVEDRLRQGQGRQQQRERDEERGEGGS